MRGRSGTWTWVILCLLCNYSCISEDSIRLESDQEQARTESGFLGLLWSIVVQIRTMQEWVKELEGISQPLCLLQLQLSYAPVTLLVDTYSNSCFPWFWDASLLYLLLLFNIFVIYSLHKVFLYHRILLIPFISLLW